AWTGCGACTSGWTARPRGATKPASGGAGMMNTARGKTVHAAAAARPGSGKVPARRGSAGFAGLLALAFGAAVACTANSAYVPALHELSLCAGGRAVWPPPRLDAFAAFIAMWQIMMTAMMLPSVGPALHRYRQAAHA